MLWNLATKWIGAIKTSIYIYVSPVITVILSVLILHEKITVISIIGTILILIGFVVSQKVKTTDQIRCIICDNKAKKGDRNNVLCTRWNKKMRIL
ncbi:DMT family transporter [Anaerostipes amylophilus]|uniref:DMT family transporter n=1 Tax=Anaerostipes amylophilus TaxID=2981779 RepID=UPI0009BEA0DB|nr:DMT family transporter [Anaerostipes amylophilus]MCU6781181.1 DMT family transporter [Anaerostipes amylophilus]